MVYISVDGKSTTFDATIGTNGLVEMVIAGMLPDAPVTIGVTFELTDGSGGISVQGHGTAQ